MNWKPRSNKVTKQGVLAELESLRQGHHARYQTLVGRFGRCREWQRAAALCAVAVEAGACTTNTAPLDAPPGWLPPLS